MIYDRRGMDSIFIFEIDRINRISWIFYIPGFRMKPGICFPLRGIIERRFQDTVSIHNEPISYGTPYSVTLSLMITNRQYDAVDRPQKTISISCK